MEQSKDDSEDVFYTPRPSIDFRGSLENRTSVDDMRSCHDSILPVVSEVPFTVPPESHDSSSTNVQSELPGIPEASFKIRNILTGEVIDLRDENESGFAERMAELLTLRPGASLEHHM